MSTISLEASIRSCKVDSGWANRIQSDRFLNSNLMLCPVWNGVDSAGRPACADSFWTKTPGCNSSSDRVLVENSLRPQYIEYVNLDASGIRGGQECGNNNVYSDTVCHQKVINDTHKYTGQSGMVTGYSQYIMPNCATCQNSKHPNARAYGEYPEGYARRF